MIQVRYFGASIAAGALILFSGDVAAAKASDSKNARCDASSETKVSSAAIGVEILSFYNDAFRATSNAPVEDIDFPLDVRNAKELGRICYLYVEIDGDFVWIDRNDISLVSEGQAADRGRIERPRTKRTTPEDSQTVGAPQASIEPNSYLASDRRTAERDRVGRAQMEDSQTEGASQGNDEPKLYLASDRRSERRGIGRAIFNVVSFPARKVIDIFDGDDEVRIDSHEDGEALHPDRDRRVSEEFIDAIDNDS